MSNQPPGPPPADEAAKLLQDHGTPSCLLALYVNLHDGSSVPGLVVLVDAALPPDVLYALTPNAVVALRAQADNLEAAVAPVVVPDTVPPAWCG